MKKPNQLQKFLFRSYYQDGLWDMWLGICMIILGVGFYFFQQVEEPIAEMFATFGFVALVYATFRGTAVILRWAKKTYTHPRSGYVKFKPREKKTTRKSTIIRVGVVVFALTVINIVGTFFAGKWVVDLFRWTLISGAFAGVLVWIGAQFEIKRYYITAALLFLCGIFTGLGVRYDQQIITFYLLTGGVLILMGAGTLINFLRTTKPTGETDLAEGVDHE